MAKRKRTKRQTTIYKALYIENKTTWTSLKICGELGCSGRVDSSCPTNDTRRVTSSTNPVKHHEWGSDREVPIRQVRHIRGHLWHRYPVTGTKSKFSSEDFNLANKDGLSFNNAINVYSPLFVNSISAPWECGVGATYCNKLVSDIHTICGFLLVTYRTNARFSFCADNNDFTYELISC